MTLMKLEGQRVRRTRWVKTDRFVIAVEVEAVIPAADPSEACYEPHVVTLLRDVQAHAERGDLAWLKQHGKVYAALEQAV